MINSHYSTRENQFSSRLVLELKLPKPYYDDIVDKTDYIPDSELIRQQKAGSAATTKGIYDYNSLDEWKNKNVSPLEVKLRSLSQNQLDIADLPVMLQRLSDEAQSEAEKKAAEETKAKYEELRNLREARLNEMLGISDESSE